MSEPIFNFEANLAALEAKHKAARENANGLRNAHMEAERETSRLSYELVLRNYGVRIGAIGVIDNGPRYVGRDGKRVPGAEFMVVRFGSYGGEKPSVDGVLRNKDGSWSKARRYIGTGYEIVGYEPVEEE